MYKSSEGCKYVCHLPDSSMLSVSGCRLKGSVGELRRWRRMMERSMMLPDGSITGSVIRVSIRGSITATDRETENSHATASPHTSQPRHSWQAATTINPYYCRGSVLLEPHSNDCKPYSSFWMYCALLYSAFWSHALKYDKYNRTVIIMHFNSRLIFDTANILCMNSTVFGH